MNTVKHVNAVTSTKQSFVFKDHAFFSCHRKLYMNWTYLKDHLSDKDTFFCLKGDLLIQIWLYEFIKLDSRLGQIVHAGIRMGCSALNSDLFRKNIVNSPHCTCSAIETPTHYLLNCPHYNIPRQRHIFALNLPIPLSTQLLLVGSNELTINQNTEIFLSVQKFILSSKRFTP
jgi:hypothetical protein